MQIEESNIKKKKIAELIRQRDIQHENWMQNVFTEVRECVQEMS